MDLETGTAASINGGPPVLLRRESSRAGGLQNGSTVEDLNAHDATHHTEGQTSVEFVPPIEGTPAALALAANAAIKMSRLEKNLQKIRAIRRPKMKSLNIVKRINKTTKAKRKKHFSKNFKGKVIDGLHELYTLTAGMMLGIRYSADRVANAPQEIQRSDYEQLEIVAFPPKGNPNPPYITPPHSLAHTFEFKSYAPKVFKNIRSLFDIDTPSYMNSVCGDYNFIEFISNSKSGQFFFYSHDGKYMLKTQTKEEKRFMQRILPQYHAYVKANPYTLLVRILGMHRIKMYHLRRKVHFVIMGSVFDSPVKINTIYDLKGSLHGRNATAKERASGGVLKDQDLLDDHRKLHLGKKKPAFMLQLRKDAQFLADNNIMDYSLLIGIHDRTTRGQENTNTTTIATPTTNNNVAIPATIPLDNHQQQQQTVSADHQHALLTTDSSLNTSNHNINTNANTNTHARPHSNTPFRRSIHESIDAAELSNQQKIKRTMSMTKKDAATHTASASGEDHDINQTLNISMNEEEYDDNDQEGDDQETYSDNDNDNDEDNDDDVDNDNDEYEDIDEGDSDTDNNNNNTNTTMSSPGRNSRARGNTSNNHAINIALAAAMKDLNPNTNNTTTGAIHHHPASVGESWVKPWTSRVDGGINSHGQGGRGNEIYFVGVIDILQEYNTNKRMETVFKGITSDVRQISSVDPLTYAKRFVAFMENNID